MTLILSTQNLLEYLLMLNTFVLNYCLDDSSQNLIKLCQSNHGDIIEYKVAIDMYVLCKNRTIYL